MVQKVVYKNKNNLIPNKEKKCKRKKPKTEDLSKCVKMEVRDRIYELYRLKTNITLPFLRDVLKQRGTLEIGLSALSKLIKSIGFRYKKDCNRRYLCELPNIVSQRIGFLRQYTQNEKSKLRKVVFLDVTWIFSNRSGIKSWQDESVKSVKRKKGCGQGKRFIILHAGSSTEFVSGASLIFSSKSKSMDYHDNMNCEMFEKWLKEQLIPNLQEPSLIVLDNESYHSRILNKQPNGSWRKSEIYEWLVKENQNPLPYMLKSEVLSIVKSLKRPKIYAVGEIVREYGHEVLRLPPYHCQFNAIELIWAGSKSYYEKHVGAGLRSDQVEAVWNEALNHITKEYWRKSVAHTKNIIRTWWKREKVLDIQVEPLIIAPFEEDSENDEQFSDSVSDNDSYN
ncbi:uncharacterized protein LOC126734938 isoform X1 [Anthonomus grandis grandis]|uniref:uncharacterized protein LOC126734938 isoform X1 n=1 Tax=Anthonomus grandis grandis TaxID=2921223 RepID=UPI0021666B42|nr:uncharacterized protein LOC126734938 isoform X1 [Anthonomus grandis grandis]XP_050294742.1 uncharacterized protein LOC126734938 isoform X1 [Anthonomus grandis grandis]XP_050294743.1 uncharacterized protein LOC126734938 isoform X1 [Anthonomus grandis grandis]XP_050294744.1 uncharacterized protein LOC126734938 isoform X1 [Anthonomus grandis grandis]